MWVKWDGDKKSTPYRGSFSSHQLLLSSCRFFWIVRRSCPPPSYLLGGGCPTLPTSGATCATSGQLPQPASALDHRKQPKKHAKLQPRGLLACSCPRPPATRNGSCMLRAEKNPYATVMSQSRYRSEKRHDVPICFHLLPNEHRPDNFQLFQPLVSGTGDTSVSERRPVNVPQP